MFCGARSHAVAGDESCRSSKCGMPGTKNLRHSEECRRRGSPPPRMERGRRRRRGRRSVSEEILHVELAIELAMVVVAEGTTDLAAEGEGVLAGFKTEAHAADVLAPDVEVGVDGGSAELRRGFDVRVTERPRRPSDGASSRRRGPCCPRRPRRSACSRGSGPCHPRRGPWRCCSRQWRRAGS